MIVNNELDVGGSSRGLTWGTIPAYAQRDWRKPQKTSVRIVDVLAKDWN
jgi:hypothetical protein